MSIAFNKLIFNKHTVIGTAADGETPVFGVNGLDPVVPAFAFNKLLGKLEYYRNLSLGPTEEISKLAVGDIVQLKSGSPAMTISKLPSAWKGTTLAHCIWFSGAEINSIQVSIDCLVRAKSEA